MFSLTGQVYRLRTPTAAYLASMQAYDSSNPTKDWVYPQLSTKGPIKRPCQLGGNSESTMIQGNSVRKDSLIPEKLSVAPKVSFSIGNSLVFSINHMTLYAMDVIGGRLYTRRNHELLLALYGYVKLFVYWYSDTRSKD